MAQNIEKANQLISEKLPTNWWISFDFDKTTVQIADFTPQIKNFKALLIDLENQIFDFLNFSILTGEYCQQNNFEKELSDLKSQLDTIPPTDLFPPENIQAVLQKDLREDFIEPLKLALNFYSEFHRAVKTKITLSNIEYILTYHEEIMDAVGTKKYDKNSRQNLVFLNTNIYVARCDHFMTYETDDYKTLFNLARDLTKELNLKPYAPVLRYKCRFLIAKILIRKRKESNVPVYILKNTIEEEFSLEEYDNDNIFKKEFEYILTHYEIKDGWKNYISKDFDEIKQKNYSQMSVKELHRVIKYYKDVNPSIDCLKNIRSELQKRFDNAHKEGNHSDYYAYAIALNYTINNEFSLLCESEKTKIEDAEVLYDEITRIEKQTGVRNFFPQTKYLDFLLDQLNLIYEKKKALEFVEPCRDIIEKCHDIFDLYEQNVAWSTKNYNYVFQLPHGECFYKTKSEIVPQLFIFSTFLMPLPRKKYEQEFANNQMEVFNMSSSIDVFENVYTEFEELKKLKTDLKVIQDEVNKKEVRTLEVLGIFTAIVTFVASSIPTFKFVNSGVEAFLFMFALACSLGIFVLLLLTINRGVDAFKKNQRVIYPLMALAAIIWILVIFCDKKGAENNVYKNEENLNKEEQTVNPNLINSNNNFYIVRDTLATKSKVKKTDVKQVN